MTAETALWIMGSVLLPLLGWGIHITWSLQKTKEGVARLVEMHHEPDKYGFGTAGTNQNLADLEGDLHRCVEANTRAVKQLTHYIKWLAKQQGAGDPQPPVED